MKRNMLTAMVGTAVGLAFLFMVIAAVPHSMVTYIIVPFADVTKAMLDLVAETSMDTLRHSTSGEDRVVLKFVRYKQVADPMPNTFPNDKAMTAGNLEQNMKLSSYVHAHKITPGLLRPYTQYTHVEIQVELEKLDWTGGGSVTNGP